MATTSDALAHLRHELHTPLNHIIGFSEMLIEEADETGTADLLPAYRQVHQQARNLLERIDALLGAGEADCAQARLASELSPPLGRLSELAQALKSAAAEAG